MRYHASCVFLVDSLDSNLHFHSTWGRAVIIVGCRLPASRPALHIAAAPAARGRSLHHLQRGRRACGSVPLKLLPVGLAKDLNVVVTPIPDADDVNGDEVGEVQVEGGPEVGDRQQRERRVDRLHRDEDELGLPALGVEHLAWLHDANRIQHGVHRARDARVRRGGEPADRRHQARVAQPPPEDHFGQKHVAHLPTPVGEHAHPHHNGHAELARQLQPRRGVPARAEEEERRQRVHKDRGDLVQRVEHE
mmetsp:Transcript_29309/g.94477  ORF Transcript_29309/g.94477 Transcript_29309/m.94477 type:complete len:249 (-) Transcript_29309:591-1337(-)